MFWISNSQDKIRLKVNVKEFHAYCIKKNFWIVCTVINGVFWRKVQELNVDYCILLHEIGKGLDK